MFPAPATPTMKATPKPTGDTMKLLTKYFGEIDYDPADCINFENGIYAFEDELQFLLLPFADSEGAMLCLQSVQTPGLAFVLMDPFALLPDYTPVLQPSELSVLGVADSRELCYYVMCAVKKPVSDSTVNLKCPITINPDTLSACQVILDSDRYTMRHPLSEFARDKGGASKC